MHEIPLIDPQKLDSNALALSEMVCHECLDNNLLRSQARYRLFRELDVELITYESADGWWIAAAVDPAEGCLIDGNKPYSMPELEDAVSDARCKCIHFDDEWGAGPPDPISDYVLPQIIEEQTEIYYVALQVLAGSEEDAEMGLLALLLDENVDIAFDKCNISRLYSQDPRPDDDTLRDIWRHVVGECLEAELAPILIEINDDLDMAEDDEMHWMDWNYRQGSKCLSFR